MRRFRRTPGRSGWQTSRVGIKSGATGLDDEPVRRPRLPRRDELSGLPLLIEAPLAIGLDDLRERGGVSFDARVPLRMRSRPPLGQDERESSIPAVW